MNIKLIVYEEMSKLFPLVRSHVIKILPTDWWEDLKIA